MIGPKGLYAIRKNDEYLTHAGVDVHLLWGVTYEAHYTTDPRLVLGFKDEHQAEAIAYLLDAEVVLWED